MAITGETALHIFLLQSNPDLTFKPFKSCIILCTICVFISAWSPVERGIKIPFDLESTPLQIKTNSAANSGDQIYVRTYTGDVSYIGDVAVQFTSPVTYFIAKCIVWSNSLPELPVQPPDEVEKIWTIGKTATNLSIECNGVEVLNYQFSDSSDTRCVPRWGGDVVEKILFLNYDTASDSYRAKPAGKK